MYSDILTNKKMAIAVVLVQLALLGTLVLYPNSIIAVLAVLSFLLAAAVWRFGFIIKPIIARQANVMEGFGKYEMPSSQDMIIKKEGNQYFATTYLLVRFTHSNTEKTPDQIAVMRQSYERALSSLNYVYKISNMVCPVDLTQYVDKIKERRSSCESRLSEISSLPQDSNTGSEMAILRREIDSCENQLQKIQSGEKPMRVMNFAMTTASSHSREDAARRVMQQAAELRTVISSTLDTEVMNLSGDELKRCFEWDYMLPDKDETEEFLY